MSGRSAAAEAVRFRDRLLTEAVRCAEAQRDRAEDDHTIVDEVRALTERGSDEEFLIARARLMPVSGDLDRALDRQARILWLVLLAALATTALIGVGTARAVLGVERAEPVNIFWLLGGVLGGQLVLLALWVALAIFGSRALAGASLGGLMVGMANWITRRVKQDATNVAAVEASLAVTTTGALGRWSLSALVHALWSSFNLGLVVMLILLLSARQYTFAWESTILSASGYRTMTAAVARLPDAVGFTTPDEESIRAARFDPTDPSTFVPQSDEARAAWSGLLVGSVVCYGLAPRVLLLLWCAVMARRAAKRYRLPLQHPAYARLLRRRAQPLESNPSRDEESASPMVTTTARATARPAGEPAIVGIELHPPATGWPPAVPGARWQDFGIVDDRPSRQKLIDRLESTTHEPSPLIVVADLTVTPDRGLARLLASIRGAVRSSPILLLTAGGALRQRSGSAETVAHRAEVWRSVAREAGFDESRLIGLDLDHLTEASAARVRGLLNEAGNGASPASDRHRPSRLAEALQLVDEHAAAWIGAHVEPKAVQKLHQAIAALYRADGRLADWFRRVASSSGAAPTDPESLRATVRSATERFQGWLPEALRSSPRWAVAGALTGAVGCVSAAALLSPVVIGALPMWSIVGGAIGALGSLQRHHAASVRAIESTEGPARSDAIRAAALYTMVLDLQPADEPVIARVLASTTDGLPDLADDASDAARRRWLDELAGRFQAALTKERAS